MTLEQNNYSSTLTTTLTTTNTSLASTMVNNSSNNNNNGDLLKQDTLSMSSNQNRHQEESTTTTEEEAKKKEEDEAKKKKENRRKMIKFILDQGKEIGLMLFINVGLSLALYHATKGKVGEVYALIIGGIPPLLFVIFKFWQKRKVDIVGCIFVVAFIGSAILSVITGDARIALFRDATVDLLIAFIFWVTLIPINTRWFKMEPLIYLITKQMISEAPKIEWIETDQETGEEITHSQSSAEWIWNEVTFFRRFCYILTFIWGLVMSLNFAVKAIIILATSMTVDQIVAANSIIQIVITVTMTTGTTIVSAFCHKRISKKLNEFRETHKMIEPTEEESQQQ